MIHHLRKNARRIHRSLVPIASAPLILTVITGIAFSILDQRKIEADWLLQIHSGNFGPLNLQPYYAYLLGICMLVLTVTGVAMWLGTRQVHARRS